MARNSAVPPARPVRPGNPFPNLLTSQERATPWRARRGKGSMSELGRRTPWPPFLLQTEGLAQGLSAHMGRYWALWLALVLAMGAAGIGLFTGLERLATRWDYPYDHSWLVVGM